MQKLFAKTSRAIAFQAGFMPKRDRSGPSWLNATTRSERPKFFLGSLVPVAFSGAHTAYTLKRGEVYLGLSNEVRSRRFPSPSFGFPSHSFFPSTHLLVLFRFTSSCPHVPSSHLFPSFAHTRLGP